MSSPSCHVTVMLAVRQQLRWMLMATPSDFPRTLTQMLREWDDAALTELLLARPDLAFPPPTDLTQIASRATTRHSVSAALDSLNAFEMEVARRASALPVGCTPTDLLDPELNESAVLGALQRLRRLALMWGDATALRPVRAFSALLADIPASPVPPPQPPSFPEAARQPLALVDKVAAGSAFEFVRRIEVLIEHCDHQPVRLRQAGGLASREVKIVAALLDVPTVVATAHLDVAQAAGLLGITAKGIDEVLLPTTEFDSWQGRALAQQWADLAATWFEADAAGGPPWLKLLCLQAFGSPVDGRVLSAGELRAWVAWHRPRRAPATGRQVATVLDQASWIGVTGLGAVSSFAPELDVANLQAHLPPRTEHVVVQADLTAIAPGPLTADASRELGALADVESRGGATVYRFTAGSLRRAFQLGWEVPDILNVLEARSRTALPQPLRYLVQDLARGRADAGHAAPATQGGASSAPTQPIGAHQNPQRTSPSNLATEQSGVDRLTPDQAAALVSQLKRADTTSAHRRDDGQSPVSVVTAPVDVLREAVETGEVVWLSLVDGSGVAGERLVHAVDVSDGELRALDARCGERVNVPIRRITAAHILRGGS